MSPTRDPPLLAQFSAKMHSHCRSPGPQWLAAAGSDSNNGGSPTGEPTSPNANTNTDIANNRLRLTTLVFLRRGTVFGDSGCFIA